MTSGGENVNPNNRRQPPLSQQAIEGLGLGGAIPQGLKVKYPNRPFPKEVREWLEEARKRGRYVLFCATIDPEADARGEPFDIHMYRSVGFDPDWVLKAWKLMGQNIMAIEPGAIGEVPPPLQGEDDSQ